MVSTNLRLQLVNDPNRPPHSVVLSDSTGPLILGRDPNPKGEQPYFLHLDSKVVSRNHACIAVDNLGKVTVQDTKSSAGTFLNSMRLSPPKVLSNLFDVRDGDYLQFGEDCEVNGVQFKCVLFRIYLAPLEQMSKPEIPSVDNLETEKEEANEGPQEFDSLWQSMMRDIEDCDPLILSLLDQITEIASA